MMLTVAVPQVNSRKADGTTPLILASGKGHRDIAALLLERGADIALMGLL